MQRITVNCFRSLSFRNNDLCLQYSSSQPLPRRRRDNRRRGNSLTLYHTAVANSQLRRNSNKHQCCSNKTSPVPHTFLTDSQRTQTPDSQAKSIDDSLGILRDSSGKLLTKNIEEMSTSTAADGDRLTAKNIDDSLDILLDSSDAAVVPVSSVDSGRSSCESSVLPAAYQQSPSVSPAYLTISAQSGPTMSTSSSFNELDIHPNCFSSDGSFNVLFFNVAAVLQLYPQNTAAENTPVILEFKILKIALCSVTILISILIVAI